MPTTTTVSIPTYKGHWLWGGTFEAINAPIDFYEKRMAALGDTYYVRFPVGKLMVTANPDLMKHILQGNHRNYEKDVGYDQLALLLGRGLVTSRGDFWRKQRRIAQPAFYKKSLVKLYEDMRVVGQQYVEELNDKRGQTIDMSREMMAVTAKIAMKSLFTKDLDSGLKAIYDCISYSQKYVTSRFLNPMSIPFTYINGKHRQFKKQKKVMDDLIFGLIEERKKSSGEFHDFMQILMDARYEDGTAMPKRLLADELVTIFSAGHETSSNGMTWTLYLLSQHPEILAKVRAEAERVVGKGIPTFEQLRQLTYTQQVLEESMRLFPPVWAVGRYPKEEDNFNGLRLKKNQIIVAMVYLLHHHPDIWENPEVFDPERFTPERVKARPKHHYMPFIMGPRMCIGNHFAMMEMQMLLPALVQNFDFELMKGQKIELEPLVTLRPKYGMNMIVK